MKYFVSADIHGFYSAWKKGLDEKGFDVNNPEHKIIVVGDLFDRGNEASKLQSFVMELIEKDKIILIRGNHEDLALELIHNYYRYIANVKGSHHYHNGTFQTLLSLTDMDFNMATTCLLEFKKRAYETDYLKHIIPKMKNYYETDNYVFTHAWLPLSEEGLSVCENWRNASEEAWARARWQNPLVAYKLGLTIDKTLVFGHWHCSAFWAHKDPKKYQEDGETACYEPYVADKIIALDACTVRSKKVNVILLED